MVARHYRDGLERPFASRWGDDAHAGVLTVTVERATQHRRLRTELKRLRQRVELQDLPKMVRQPGDDAGDEPRSRIAPTDASVLISGESGTGKELIAKAIHDRSGRKGPFLAINCAAVPETLLESELFGHTRGAFTDAHATRKGLFHRDAHGGTLFLDEIGEMAAGMQAKILRALQERKVRPVGGSTETPFDARIITATNRDLEAARSSDSIGARSIESWLDRCIDRAVLDRAAAAGNRNIDLSDTGVKPPD